ncbi:MAG: peptidase carboxypeptidase [Rhizobacter sp.]|nr:peptidase carboxypeptidase [Rhizobacter sp.]
MLAPAPLTLTPVAPPEQPPAPAETFAVPSQALPPMQGLPSTPSLPAPSSTSSGAYVETPAVAARFPEPAINYQTPGLMPGRTDFTTNAELRSFMRGLAEINPNRPNAARLIELGHSQAGAPLAALLFTRLPDGVAEAPATAGRPTVLLIAGQHGDEPAGAEALMVVSQQLAGNGRLAALLDRINVIVVPRANPDGAETAAHGTIGGIDLDRDHLALATPEAQALSTLARVYRPMVVVDSHEYTPAGAFLQNFGAVGRNDVLIQYAMTANLPEFITKAQEEWFRVPMLAAFRSEGLNSDWYYTAANNAPASAGSASADLDSKLSMGRVQADNGRNVNGLRNAVSFAIESRGGDLGRAHIKRRIHAQVVAIASALQVTADRAADLGKLRNYVDAEVASRACQGTATIEAAATSSEYRLTALDPQTGADKRMTVSWDSALLLDSVRRRPRPCGYWLAGEAMVAVERLRALGVEVQQLSEPGTVKGEAYRESSRGNPALTLSTQPSSNLGTAMAGNMNGTTFSTVAQTGSATGPASAPVKVGVRLLPAVMDLPPGSYYVRLDQPLGNLVLAAMEPDSDSSYLSHGVIANLDQLARVMQVPKMQLTPVP